MNLHRMLGDISFHCLLKETMTMLKTIRKFLVKNTMVKSTLIKGTLVKSVIVTACIWGSGYSVAEPYIAQKSGMKCSACHTNMTGGGKRNVVGGIYANSLAAEALSGFSANLNDHISTGANIRANWSYTQFPEAEPVEGDTNPIQDPEDTSAFNITNGSMYFEFALDKDILFYVDQQVAPEGGRTREALMIYKNILADNSYLKVGKMYLPFGLRLQDDQAFIREVTGFNFDNSDVGFEVGYEPGSWSLSFAATNGTQGSGENNTDKQLSFVGSYVKPNYRLGASFSSNNAPQGISNTAYNLFGGVNIGKFTLLGEVDWLENEIGEEETSQLITFLSINYPQSNSLNYKLSYEFLEPDDDIEENERTRISFVAEKFVNQYTQFRAGVRVYEGIPQNSFQNQDVLFTELHLFY